MLPKAKDILLKERVQLYNNLARNEDCSGRLAVALEVYPIPRISWEFEILGESECHLGVHLGTDEPVSPFIGHWFSIEQPLLTGIAHDDIGPRSVFRGTTVQADFGALDAPAHTFRFYLPNAKFQERSPVGQVPMFKRIKEGKKRKYKGLEGAGRAFEAVIDSAWSIRLQIDQNALDWLDGKNIGCIITTSGALTSKKSHKRNSESKRATLTLRDATELFNTLRLLLSYANGGYLGPLYVDALYMHPEQPEIVAASAMRYRTTPLEQLGTSWIAVDSDLSLYLQCFSTFHTMLHSPPWDEAFDVILAWYFQSTYLGRAWPIIANAIGTALERLSYTILVLEEKDNTKRQRAELLFERSKQDTARKEWAIGKKYGGADISITGKRLQLLLERIGLTKARGYNDVDDAMAFLEVRNEATHPKPGAITYEERNRLLHQATQWIDEILLWRLGYNGKYLDRSKKWRTSREPRYDLSTRNPNW
jgi:hypothetical protein